MQILFWYDAAVATIHPTAREDELVGHELVRSCSLAHQDPGRVVVLDDNERGRIAWFYRFSTGFPVLTRACRGLSVFTHGYRWAWSLFYLLNKPRVGPEGESEQIGMQPSDVFLFLFSLLGVCDNSE